MGERYAGKICSACRCHCRRLIAQANGSAQSAQSALLPLESFVIPHCDEQEEELQRIKLGRFPQVGNP